ncbi:hypothetical protein ACFQYP_02610 [Nonomuraea antimicrobica]
MHVKSRVPAILVAAGVLVGSIAALSSPSVAEPSAAAAPGTVVVSQVYGGGGNSGAP